MEWWETGSSSGNLPGLSSGNSPRLWWVENGVYRCYTEGYAATSYSTAGDMSWTDYHVEYDIKSFGSVNQLIMFRTLDPENTYRVNVRSDPWNDAFLERYVNGVREELASRIFYNDNEVWHHYEIDVIGKNISVRIDGVLVFFVYHADADWLAGGIGLMSFAGGAILWQDLYIDNVKVTAAVIGTENTTWSDVKSLYQ